MIVTLRPFGVPSEYSCSGCLPTGSSFSYWAPAVGRLILANRPRAGLATQTLGGAYSGVSVIPESPRCYGRTRTPRAFGSSYTISPPSGTRHAPALGVDHICTACEYQNGRRK